MARVGDAPLGVTRLVLASASPARRALLEAAGIGADVIVSGVDEPALSRTLADLAPADLCLELARAKAVDVARRLAGPEDEDGTGDDLGPHVGEDEDLVVIGCDSVLEVDGVAYGKPADADEARRRWRAMSGSSGTLHTGHWLIRLSSGQQAGRVASTTVVHASPTDREIEAYIATGEPMRVAGGFTLDGLGAPFVERIEGDPSNVVGLSLPLLRLMLAGFGITWTDLWATPGA